MIPRAGGLPAPGAPGPAGATRLRLMVPADLDGVNALEHQLFPDDSWSPETFAAEVVQPPDSRLYLVAETTETTETTKTSETAGAALAGYAGMMFIPGETQADVLTIAVDPRSWGQGIGSALLDALLTSARGRGCAEVFLEVRADNPRARGLYLRRGFAEIGVRRGYYQPSGTDAIVMRKDMLT